MAESAVRLATDRLTAMYGKFTALKAVSLHQLVKLAGLNPSHHESGTMRGRTLLSRRGRAGLRTVVYLATLAALQHNPRLRAHYDRLRQREVRPLETMPAMVACMNKWLLYAFAVMNRRQALQVGHVWPSHTLAAAS